MVERLGDVEGGVVEVDGPRDELEREKQTFCRLVTRPEVYEALTQFVHRDDVRPYLP